MIQIIDRNFLDFGEPINNLEESFAPFYLAGELDSENAQSERTDALVEASTDLAVA